MSWFVGDPLLSIADVVKYEAVFTPTAFTIIRSSRSPKIQVRFLVFLNPFGYSILTFLKQGLSCLGL